MAIHSVHSNVEFEFIRSGLQISYKIHIDKLSSYWNLGGIMPDFITLTCPSYGGKINITHDIERFTCAHCGTEHIVKRGEEIIALTPVIEEVRGVRKAVDHTASELAIVRIQKDIDYLSNQLIMRNTRLDYIGIVIGIVLLFLSIGFAKDFSPTFCYGGAIGSAIFIIRNIDVILKKENGRKELQALLNAKIIELRKYLDIVNSR